MIPTPDPSPRPVRRPARRPACPCSTAVRSSARSVSLPARERRPCPPVTPTCWPSSATRSRRRSPRCGSSESLQHSRAALVTAREEERRRLRRDLHDGVGAALAGIRLQVETARDLVTDPVAGGLLRSAAAGVATAVDDVRAITDDLRPSVLDDLGLEAGLRGLADRMATPAIDVDVDVDLVGPLSAAVEVACYRIAAEALANAIRHAGARRVAVQLGGTATWVSLRVEDDGDGLPEQPARRRPRARLDAPTRGRDRRAAGGHQRRIGHPRSRRPAVGGPMSRILLIDDHPLFLDGVRAALTGADDLEIVGEAHDAGTANRARGRARARRGSPGPQPPGPLRGRCDRSASWPRHRTSEY